MPAFSSPQVNPHPWMPMQGISRNLELSKYDSIIHLLVPARNLVWGVSLQSGVGAKTTQTVPQITTRSRTTAPSIVDLIVHFVVLSESMTTWDMQVLSPYRPRIPMPVVYPLLCLPYSSPQTVPPLTSSHSILHLEESFALLVSPRKPAKQWSFASVWQPGKFAKTTRYGALLLPTLGLNPKTWWPFWSVWIHHWFVSMVSVHSID